jgi:uncharacterized membrane protein YhiD involved in acid resistance
MTSNLSPRNKKELITLAVVFAVVLLVSALAVYFIGGSSSPPASPPAQTQTQDTAEPVQDPIERSIERRTPAPQRSPEAESFIDRMFGSRQPDLHFNGKRWPETLGIIALRFLLASLLGAALAFRPRQPVFGLKRNPYVSQTQILLAIVAAALMIIVGDNAARAFGIFAAVSLVRFRTNIRDPKEITVLLISLALGLASGVGRWDLAIVLVTFSLLVLWLLEWREPKLVFRSMDLIVTTKDIVTTRQALGQIFAKHGFDSELRSIDRGATPDAPGELVYSVDVSPMITTDQLSEELFELDEQHVAAIKWDPKKNYSYLYQ